ncbi:MAG: hypothetical protein HY720_27500 [Planctomycetes bacterium]|nr:hypothetical protein [Planctomycetota bacterium]
MDAPLEVPDPADRGAWKGLARSVERGEGPAGWTLHRPALGVYGLSFLVFSGGGALCLALAFLGGAGSGLPPTCTLVACSISLAIGGLCLPPLLWRYRFAVVLAPGFLYASYLYKRPLVIPWDQIRRLELGVSKNARGTRETYAVIAVEYEDDTGAGLTAKIGNFALEEAKAVHADMTRYREEFGSGRRATAGSPPAGGS